MAVAVATMNRIIKDYHPSKLSGGVTAAKGKGKTGQGKGAVVAGKAFAGGSATAAGGTEASHLSPLLLADDSIRDEVFNLGGSLSLLAFRATHGHSTDVVLTSRLGKRIDLEMAVRMPCLAHGTHLSDLSKILSSGLLPGGIGATRNCVHFAIFHPWDYRCEGGMRLGGIADSLCDCVLFCDVVQMVAEGLPLYVTLEGVVLCDQTVPARCIRDAVWWNGKRVTGIGSGSAGGLAAVAKHQTRFDFQGGSATAALDHFEGTCYTRVYSRVVVDMLATSVGDISLGKSPAPTKREISLFAALASPKAGASEVLCVVTPLHLAESVDLCAGCSNYILRGQLWCPNCFNQGARGIKVLYSRWRQTIGMHDKLNKDDMVTVRTVARSGAGPGSATLEADVVINVVDPLGSLPATLVELGCINLLNSITLAADPRRKLNIPPPQGSQGCGSATAAA